MKPHSILIVFDVPSEAGPAQSEWLTLSQTIEAVAKKNTQIQMLAANILLIPLQNGLQQASDLISLAGRRQVRYRVLYFEQEPQWIRSSPQNIGGVLVA